MYPAVTRPAVGVSPWAVTIARCWVFRGIGELGSRAWSATGPGHLRVPLWPVWRRMYFVCGFPWVCARPFRVLRCHYSRGGSQGAGCGCECEHTSGWLCVCTLGVVPIINHWPPGLGPVPSSPIRPPLVLGDTHWTDKETEAHREGPCESGPRLSSNPGRLTVMPLGWGLGCCHKQERFPEIESCGRGRQGWAWGLTVALHVCVCVCVGVCGCTRAWRGSTPSGVQVCIG